jgi:hypothetical protein
MRTFLADAVLIVHFAIAAFIVAGLGLTWVGAACGWRWIRNFPFRLAHLAAIVFVALEGLLGITCPLTLWEDSLRQASGGESFVARWVQRLLYYELPEWMFTSAYVAVALATALTWRQLPPRRRHSTPV